jgi:hypothetical protein
MTVQIQCRCGHTNNARAFIPHTSSRQEKRVDADGRVRKVTIDTTPANLWACPSCKARWKVTRDGIVPVANEAETREAMRQRYRKAWGLEA